MTGAQDLLAPGPDDSVWAPAGTVSCEFGRGAEPGDGAGRQGVGVEADGFAAMLRELKERSGRSYGVLASRLHVSTSTLHRYCNGAAVPNEYAPVERFARVCGAQDAELVELHRRWILADAARRREPGGGAAAVPAVAAVPAPAVEAAPAADAPAAPPVVQPVEVVESGARSRWSRSRVLVGVAVLVVLAAAVPAYLLREQGHTAADAAGTPTAPAVAPAVPTSPTSPTSPISTGASAGAAPASASASASAAATSQDPPAPFHVSVLNDTSQSPCDQWFLSPRPPGKVTPPPTPTSASDAWASGQEAVPAGNLHLQLTALGDSSEVVVLNAMYIQVVDTQPAFKGYAYSPGSGCGGGLEPAAFKVDLDASPPKVVLDQGNEGKSTRNFPYSVSNTDPQVIEIDASTKSQDVSWYVDVVWTGANGRQSRTRVGDHGKPFRTVGMKGAPAYFLNGHGWEKGDVGTP
ncbi:helix-turn-helix domain-containing protein [Kitasatospora sp. NPDC101183]|uniref:helix-turn-helix domain-containing protein n=1 Tax=Kitasatospora sp. NPDC101183 TaxID=3364100 RepID=UPI003828190E